jgi:hypothetical protein
MATHKALGTQAGQDMLDELVRSSLTGEARRITPADRVLRTVLQRAQTEIEQLPPTVSEERRNGVQSAPAARPSAALLHRSPETMPMRRALHEQIAQQRQLMDMKMWRTLGALNLALNVTL